jgi:hypothetical protein
MTIGELKALLAKSPDDREIFVETTAGFRPITGIGVLKQLDDGGVHARYLATTPSDAEAFKGEGVPNE